MIDKINKQIEEFEENKIEIYKSQRVNLFIHLDSKSRSRVAFLNGQIEQAKKDKEIIEKGLEELKHGIKDINSNIEINDDVKRGINLSIKVINQKLKNQNGK